MKDLMLAMMSAMMPYMIYVAYLGAAVAAAGFLLLVLNLISGSMGGLLRLMGKILVGVAIFFIACELAGAFLGAAPSINLGDENKFEFILIRFWQLGLASLVIGLIYLLSGKRSTQSIEA